MLVRRGARAGRGVPWGCAALCLLSLLPCGFTNDSLTADTTEGSTLNGSSSSVSTTVSHPETTTPLTLESTTTSYGPLDSTGTTGIVNVTSTSGTTPVSEPTNASIPSQIFLNTTVFSTTELTNTENTSAPNVTLSPGSTPSVNVSDDSLTPTSPEMTSPTKLYTSAPSATKGEIKCVGIKEVKLTHSICLELNKTSSCEDFKKDRGKDLIQILCGKEEADAASVDTSCSLLLAQSEVKPQCLLVVLANSTELSRKYDVLKKHRPDLEKLGIQNFSEQDVGVHQSYSRKTLIALVTSGILLAILGTTGYFLMNRRSWSPTGERLGEDPYDTENSGGQGYSSGPGASSEAQGKASVNQGAQENGTGQATSRNGHSARQHVADTEL
ncbi:hematopoietic progenitor cell antigen CD34 isoform X2 [Octodon degus]|uniref:Hematopoietic progenitor cell antigen CD34 isoform X2 n=1 Tax=Octodon degus TaxID=10160 RepID=A0A6P6DA90_OCTDE|nr:hematopoietic progenitor cell antigen CD34 isoform X2 [Octodon degus]